MDPTPESAGVLHADFARPMAASSPSTVGNCAAAATRDMFVRDGKADTKLSQTGAPVRRRARLAARVRSRDAHVRQAAPGRSCSSPRARVAEGGFAMNAAYAKKAAGEARD
jgi:hypothetical protein